MRALVITAAGTSSRFEKSLGTEALKCVYSEGDTSETLLGRLLGQTSSNFDRVVIVGGYRFDELESFVYSVPNLELVYNPHFADRGSGWSLKLGLDAVFGEAVETVLFVEGDLFVDDDALSALSQGDGDAVTLSPDPVEADRSVAVYFNAFGIPRYVYDTDHSLLRIPEQFRSVYSSGQAWRFADMDRLESACSTFTACGGTGTNLEIVGPYFEGSDPDKLEVIRFGIWMNCNTIQDWRHAFYVKQGER